MLPLAKSIRAASRLIQAVCCRLQLGPGQLQVLGIIVSELHGILQAAATNVIVRSLKAIAGPTTAIMQVTDVCSHLKQEVTAASHHHHKVVHGHEMKPTIYEKLTQVMT